MQGCKTNTIILAYSAYQGDHKLCKKGENMYKQQNLRALTEPKKHYEVAFEFLFGPNIKSNQQKHLKMAILRFK